MAFNVFGTPSNVTYSGTGIFSDPYYVGSTNHSSNSTGQIIFQATESGTVYPNLTVDSEVASDVAGLFRNSIPIWQASGQDNFATSFRVNANDQVKINYIKDSSGSSGTDNVAGSIYFDPDPPTPLPEVAIVVVTQPESGLSGNVLQTQPSVKIVDVNGDVVTGSSISVTVEAIATTGTVALSGTLTVAPTSGYVYFTDLIATGYGSYYLYFTAAGLTPASSNTIFFIPDPGNPNPPIPVKPKRSYTTGSVPTANDMEINEFAINVTDKKGFVRDSNGVIHQIFDGTQGGTGTVTSVGLASAKNTIIITNSPITTSGEIDIDLSITNVTAASYTSADITVDEYGRITSASNGQQADVQAGTDISVTGSFPTFTVNNTAPDQIVTLTGGTDISISGTYPDFTIDYSGAAGGVTSIIAGTGISIDTSTGDVTVTNSSPDQVMTLTAGTGISVSGTYPNFTIDCTITQYTDADARLALSAGTGISYDNTTGVISNSDPDQIVSLTAGTGINVTGTYPSFTIDSTITQYTDADARLALSAGAGISYDNTTGIITNSEPDQIVSLTGGTDISISGTYPDFTIDYTGTNTGVTSIIAGTGISVDKSTGDVTITNSDPDQVVSITAGSGIDVTGTYPNFTIDSTITQYTDSDARKSLSAGTGISYDDTTGVISNSDPDQVVSLTAGTDISVTGTYPNFTIDYTGTSGSGTVTSIGITSTAAALTITNSPITTSGDIGVNFSGKGTEYVTGDGSLKTFPTIIEQALELITEVYNETGATLTKGTIVRINGGHGNLPTITKAQADSDANSAQTYGVVQDNITDQNNGYVVVIGMLNDLDTQAYSSGTQLYLSPTTAGAWTSTKPSAPSHLVYVGVVVRSHATQGVVEIKIQNGYELDELHDVSITSVAPNNILRYNSSTKLWENVAGTTSSISEGSNLYYTDARARASVSAGTGISYSSTTGVITNSSPDQTVVLTAGTGISTSGTYPNFTITNSSPDQTVKITAGTGISTSGTYPNFTVTNSSPDQTVVLTAGTNISITGTYPNFTINASGGGSGSVTSVDMTVPTGFKVSGNPVTTTGTLAVVYDTGYALPTTASQTNWDSAYTQRLQWDGGSTNLVAGTGRTSLGATTVGSNFFTLTNPTAVTFPRINADNTVSTLDAATFRTAIGAGTSSTTGTVTSVAALTLGTTGTDLNSSVATGTTTPVITLNVPTASATNRGALSTTDWSNFNTAYTNRITSLTTTGSSGSATLTSNTLNVPTYTLAGLGGQASSTNLTSLSSLTYVSASFVKMTASGTFSLDTSTYLTANQTITLSGDVTGSGSTAITTTLATVGATKGGTGQTTYTLGDTLYCSASNTLSKLSGNTTSTRKFLRQTGTGTVSAAPAWDTVTKTDVGLSNVENTALSTWTGSSSITTLGTLGALTVSGTTVINSLTYPSADGTSGQFLSTNGAGTLSWATATGSSAGGSTGDIQYNDGSGGFTAGSYFNYGTSAYDALALYSANAAFGVFGIFGASGQTYPLLEFRDYLGTTVYSYFDATGNLYLNAQNDIRFADADSSNYAAIQAPTTIATNYTLTLPTTAGTNNYVLKTNGSGTLSWTNAITNLIGGNSTTLLGSVPYQSNTDTTTLLSPNTTTTKKFLRQTGTGTNGAAPAWDTVVAADIASGQIALAYGGTNANLTAVNGAVAYSTASALALTAAGTSGQVLTSGGAGSPTWVNQGLFSSGRLTLTSNTPITTSDVTSATTIYYTPYNGDRISLYDGTNWATYTFSELSLSLGTLTSGLNYDIFLYNNSGTLTLELASWTNDTTRTTSLTMATGGVYLKTGALTRRYLGTLRTTSTTTTADSAANRYLWNNNNRILRNASTTIFSSSFAWSGGTREWNAGTSVTRLNFIVGLNDSPVIASGYFAVGTGASLSTAQAGFGIDSTSAFFGTAYTDSQISGYVVRTCTSTGYISGVGYHYMTALQNASSTANWYGVVGGVMMLS